MSSSSFPIKKMSALQNEIYSNLTSDDWVAKAFVGLTNAKERAMRTALTVLSNRQQVRTGTKVIRNIQVMNDQNRWEKLSNFLPLLLLLKINKLRCAFTMTELRILMSHLQKFNHSTLAEFSKNFRNLKILDLGGFSLTNHLLRTLAPNLKNLEELYLSSCEKIGDSGLIVALTHITKLKRLEISYTLATNDSLLKASEFFWSSLTHLDIEGSHCTFYFEIILALFPNLIEFNRQEVVRSKS